MSPEEEEEVLHAAERASQARLAVSRGAVDWMTDPHHRRHATIEQTQRKSGRFDPRRGLLKAAQSEMRASHAAVTLTTARVAEVRAARTFRCECQAALVGIRSARAAATAIIVRSGQNDGAGSALTAADEREWRLAMSTLRRKAQFDELFFSMVSAAAIDGQQEQRHTLERVYTLLGKTTIANLLQHGDPGSQYACAGTGALEVGHALNERIRLVVETKLASAVVASLALTVRKHNAASMISAACGRELSALAQERQRCAEEAAVRAGARCTAAATALSTAKAAVAGFRDRVTQATERKQEVEARLATLNRRLVQLTAKEKKEGDVSVGQRLAKTSEELSRSWVNLEMALKEEAAEEAANMEVESATSAQVYSGTDASASTPAPKPVSPLRKKTASKYSLGEYSAKSRYNIASRTEPVDTGDSTGLRPIESDVDADDLRLFFIPSAEATLMEQRQLLSEAEAAVVEAKAVLETVEQELSAADTHRVWVARDGGREMLRKEKVEQAVLLEPEINDLFTTVNETEAKLQRLRRSEGMVKYLQKVSALSSPSRCTVSSNFSILGRHTRCRATQAGALHIGDGMNIVANTCSNAEKAVRGVRSAQAPEEKELEEVLWVCQGIGLLQEYLACYDNVGRRLRLECIAENACRMAAHFRAKAATLRTQDNADSIDSAAAEAEDQALRHERLQLDACRILMDELWRDGKLKVAAHQKFLEVDTELQHAREEYRIAVAEVNEKGAAESADRIEALQAMRAQAVQTLVTQRAEAPLYRKLSSQVGERLGSQYQLDSREERVQLAQEKLASTAQALQKAETAKIEANAASERRVLEEKEKCKEVNKAKYSAERADASCEDAYKKEKYADEREWRAKAKGLWEAVQRLELEEEDCIAARIAATAVLDQAALAVEQAKIKYESAVSAHSVSVRAAKVGWLAMVDVAVKCADNLVDGDLLGDVGVKATHGDAVGACASFMRWQRGDVSSGIAALQSPHDPRDPAKHFGTHLKGLIISLASSIQQEVTPANVEARAKTRTWIVSVQAPKDFLQVAIPSQSLLPLDESEGEDDGRPPAPTFTATILTTKLAVDGTTRAVEHRPYGNYKISYPPPGTDEWSQLAAHPDRRFRCKLPMHVAALDNPAIYNGTTDGETVLRFVEDVSKLLRVSSNEDALPAEQLAQLDVCMGLVALHAGNFVAAATSFLRGGEQRMAGPLSTLVSNADLAMYTSLSALAALPVATLEAQMLEPQSKFGLILDAFPCMRCLVCEFCAGNYTATVRLLRDYSCHVHYDVFLSRQRKALFTAICQRCASYAASHLPQDGGTDATDRLLQLLDREALFSSSALEHAQKSVKETALTCVPEAAVAAVAAARERVKQASQHATQIKLEVEMSGEEGTERKQIRGALSRAASTGIAHKAFLMADDDQSGTVNVKELESIALQLGHALTPQQLRTVMEEVDVDGNGELDRAEFLAWYQKFFGSKLKSQIAHEKNVSISQVMKAARGANAIKAAQIDADKSVQEAKELESAAAVVEAKAAAVRRWEDLCAMQLSLQVHSILYHRVVSSPGDTSTDTAAQIQHNVEAFEWQLVTDAMSAELCNTHFVKQLRRAQSHLDMLIGARQWWSQLANKLEFAEAQHHVETGSRWSEDGPSNIAYMNAQMDSSELGSLIWVGASEQWQVSNAQRLELESTWDVEMLQRVAIVAGDVANLTAASPPMILQVTVNRLQTLLLGHNNGGGGSSSVVHQFMKQASQTAMVSFACQLQSLEQPRLQGGLEFLSCEREAKAKMTQSAQSKEWQALEHDSAMQMATAVQRKADTVRRRQEYKEQYEDLREQLSQELLERDDLTSSMRRAATNSALAKKLFREATSSIEKKRLGAESLQLEMEAATAEGRVQRQVELCIDVSSRMNEAKQAMEIARAEAAAAVSRVDECEKESKQQFEQRKLYWRQWLNEQALRDGPKWHKVTEELQSRLMELERQLHQSEKPLLQHDGGSVVVDAASAAPADTSDPSVGSRGPKIVNLATAPRGGMDSRSTASIDVALERNVAQNVCALMTLRLQRLIAEQQQERRKAKNRALRKRAAYMRATWAGQSELFSITAGRAQAEARANRCQRSWEAARDEHAEAERRLHQASDVSNEASAVAEVSTTTKAQLDYELDREQAALKRLRVEGRMKAVAKAEQRVQEIRSRVLAAGTEAERRKRESHRAHTTVSLLILSRRA